MNDSNASTNGLADPPATPPMLDPRGGGSADLTPSDVSYRSEGPRNFAQREEVTITAWAASAGIPAELVRDAAKTLAVIAAPKKGLLAHLTPDGPDVLAVHFGVEKTGAAARESASSWEPVRITVRNLPPNPRILLGETEDGLRVRVRVRDNRLFVVGQKIEARRTEPALPDIYELTSRHPRRRGDA